VVTVFVKIHKKAKSSKIKQSQPNGEIVKQNQTKEAEDFRRSASSVRFLLFCRLKQLSCQRISSGYKPRTECPLALCDNVKPDQLVNLVSCIGIGNE
jgi:hypothetical protein